MRALAPGSFRDNHYFHLYYHRLGLSEELRFFSMPGEQCRAVLPLLRCEGQAAFSKEELRLLHTAAPVVKRCAPGLGGAGPAAGGCHRAQRVSARGVQALRTGAPPATRVQGRPAVAAGLWSSSGCSCAS